MKAHYKMFKEKKIPTILGLMILLGGICAGVLFTNKNTNFISKAGGDCKPINPQVTNITNNSLTISFVTESLCLSSLQINSQSIENLAISTSGQKSKIHYFEVNSLNDDTEYEYWFINDGKNYKLSLYNTKTAPKPSGPIPSSNLAWGRVFTPELKPAAKVILFINIPGSAPLSSLITTSGNWNISLANSFNESKNGRFVPIPNTAEEIIVIDQDKQITQISGNTSQNNPTPDIILGQNKFALTRVVFDDKTNTGYLPPVTQTQNSKELDILNPKNNESLSTKKPDFFGTGPINSVIKIKVESPVVYNGEITTNNEGSWHWSPPSDLSVGEHTITATTIENGIEKNVTRKFTILAADSPLAYSASQSANTPVLTPTTIPTLTPTTSTKKTTPTTIPTLIPTIAQKTTPIITSTPIVRTTNPSTSSGIPTSGNLVPTILLLLLASSFTIFSFISLNKK